ncbi:MAG TPA: hypothetical protein VEG08_13300, partial [Terriglobales bacterium]|nr:hypothetical protein [Terriglobales bacterium]
MTAVARCSKSLMLALTGATLLLLALPLAAQRPVKFDSATVSGLSARNIGSAQMSGRIAAVDGVTEKGRTTVFVG